ncbi:cystathionine beta-lyase [Pigmentiphaga aceris]|uniref:Cystathionine beta-lyase n=1 Tax=Pigmentiphaga aceris TaxID=1940612 RepID=A0A5C0ASZ2_9BURK|nr:cystathionine beta-lyase [Pigmentiphaga aceris]QEI05175.1 cystathionine beta-lyase [Pigmentiphaga aceris]
MRDLSKCVNNPAVSSEGFVSLSTATHRASTIVFPSAQAYAERKKRGPDGFTYGLHGTPTTRALEARLTALEAGVRTALVPSGQAAIAVVLLTVLRPGDTVLIPDNAYPPVRGFAVNYLESRGIGYRLYDPAQGADIASLIDDSVKLVWVESPGSTTMEIQDIPAIVAVAHARGALVGCDNTWATPLLFKPLTHGVDFSIEAITKYIGGHSDVFMGSIAVSTVEMHRRLKDTMRMLGMGVSPDDCFLVLRGMETLGVRLQHQGRVALEMAQSLVGHAAAERVLHPALPSCPGHALWKRDFLGASGVFTVQLRSGFEAGLSDALTAMKMFSIGASWGGTHSLIAPMEISGDRQLSTWNASTILLRISIGLEDPEDLREDVQTLFARLEATRSID